jgi:hypothetical protein
MNLTVTWVDYNPPELSERLPFTIKLLRQLPGPDRPDYWLGELGSPVAWTKDGHDLSIDHVVVCARWQGTSIEPLASDLPINIAYVTDPSQVEDQGVSFDKTEFVAIGGANVSDRDPVVMPGSTQIQIGHIAPAFGVGKPDK